LSGDQKIARTTALLGALQQPDPVKFGIALYELRKIAHPLETAPSLFRPVKREKQGQMLRGEGEHVRIKEWQDLSLMPHFFFGKRRRGSETGKLPMQIDTDPVAWPPKGHLAEFPKIAGLLLAVLRGNVTFSDEDLLCRGEVVLRNDNVDIQKFS
jgi:hypothetical protein